MVLPFWGLFLVSCVYGSQEILQQPHISPPTTSHFRDLVWGDVNFIHTTDTHGWYAGHLNQKAYSGDWGDFISFTKHLHKLSDQQGTDLLLVDTGDKHDGNGLSDATNPNGKLSTPVFNEQDYDLVTIGNHELYQEDYSKQEYEVSVKNFGERYVSSNVEYMLDTGEWVPFGHKFRYFTTKNKSHRVLALSFLFNFPRYNARARVYPILKAIEQDWFKNVTSTYTEDDIDLLVVFGHIPVTDFEEEEIVHLHVALRRLYPNLVIQYFGGHSHIRDYAVYDHKATGLQSGRYCETVGWASVNFTSTQTKFSRRYIDFNRESFIHHSRTSKGDFDTEKGLSITKKIKDTRRELNLTVSYGYIPQNYLLNEHPYGHSSNLYTLLNSTILPTLENTINRDTKAHNRIILINSGSIRYDLYKGNFTIDTEFTISPFQNQWNYIKLPKSLALRLQHYLNEQDFFIKSGARLASPEKRGILNKMIRKEQFESTAMTTSFSCPFTKEPSFKKGQTTSDDLGCNGDDVLHNSVVYYPSPNVVQSYQEFNPESELVDTVFYSFIEPYIISAINILNCRHGVVDKNFTDQDVEHYGGESTGSLLRTYIRGNWS